MCYNDSQIGVRSHFLDELCGERGHCLRGDRVRGRQAAIYALLDLSQTRHYIGRIDIEKFLVVCEGVHGGI